MDKDKQRIAIAQACGWSGFNPDNIPDCIQYTAQRSDGKWGMIPDYLNDLNAMHEAEKALSAEDYWFYCDVLLPKTVMDYNDAQRPTAGFLYSARSAPAFLRAEAFLRTLNLWTPTGEENE